MPQGLVIAQYSLRHSSVQSTSVVLSRGCVRPYAPYNMESLIIEFTNKYICFYSLFKVKGGGTKDVYFREAW